MVQPQCGLFCKTEPGHLVRQGCVFGAGCVVGQRRRRSTSIEPALAAYLVFVGPHYHKHPHI